MRMRRSIAIVTVMTDVDMYCTGSECGSENEYGDMDALVANVLKVTHANTHINRQHEK